MSVPLTVLPWVEKIQSNCREKTQARFMIGKHQTGRRFFL